MQGFRQASRLKRIYPFLIRFGRWRSGAKVMVIKWGWSTLSQESPRLMIGGPLQERAQGHKARREEILVETARLKGKKEMPIKALSSKHVRSFCQALQQRLMDRSCSLGKEYLRLLVHEIRVEGKEVIV